MDAFLSPLPSLALCFFLFFLKKAVNLTICQWMDAAFDGIRERGRGDFSPTLRMGSFTPHLLVFVMRLMYVK